MKKNIRAFSLIEISFVILIISLVMVMITKSSSYFYESRLKTAISLTQSSPVKNIDGLALWLESTMPESFLYNEVGEGNNITLWRDINPQVATKNNMTRAINNSNIIYSENAANGLPAIYFNGSDGVGGFLSGELIKKVPGSFSFIIVLKLQNVETGSALLRHPFRDGIEGGGWSFARDNNGMKSIIFHGMETASSSPVNTNWEIISGTYDLGNLGVSLYTNGQAETLSQSTSSMIGGAGSFTVGAYHDIDNDIIAQWYGYIAELIVFNDIISNDDRQQIEKYLSQKYGIKLRV